MKIFMTGGSGFVGRALCRELTASGHQVHCLVRLGSEHKLHPSELIVPVQADLFSPDSLIPEIEKTDAVIHLVGIIREFPSRGINFERLHTEATRSIVQATQQAGIKRYLHMSANGARPEAPSNYHQTKWQAENTVRESGLDWTIFRPSLIYGPEDQFVNMISSLICKLPLIPVVGDGEYLLQPVAVQSVAEGFSKALDVENAIGKTYHCGGPDCLSYNQLLDLVGGALGKKTVHKLRHPLVIMRPLVRLLQHVPAFPMTSDQLQMLIEGNCCDTSEWLKDLELKPVTLGAGLEYLQRK